MAKIRSGILGNIRGKVAGVVGSQWKDVNYLREFVKPANPNTAAQQVQRTKMTDVVAFCKPLVGPVFNAYTDKFLKSMSGFNFFIKRNIDIFDGTPNWPEIFISEGKLSPIVAGACTYDTADGATVINWTENLGNNGVAADKVFWAIYDDTTGIWYLQDAEVARDAETDTQTLPTGLTATDLRCYMLVAQYTNALVTLISNSAHDAIAAP